MVPADHGVICHWRRRKTWRSDLKACQAAWPTDLARRQHKTKVWHKFLVLVHYKITDTQRYAFIILHILTLSHEHQWKKFVVISKCVCFSIQLHMALKSVSKFVSSDHLNRICLLALQLFWLSSRLSLPCSHASVLYTALCIIRTKQYCCYLICINAPIDMIYSQ